MTALDDYPAFARELAGAGHQYEAWHFARRAAHGNVLVHHFKSARKAERLALFVHGTGNDALFPQLEIFLDLLAAGIDVVSFDLDGHGRHSTTRLAPRTVLTAIKDLLRDLERRRLTPNLAIGQSLGGALILRALADGDLPVEKVAILSTPAHLGRFDPRVALELFGFASWSFLRQRHYYGVRGMLPALGNFRRAAFPIRLEEECRGFAYVKTIQEIFHLVEPLRIAPFVKVPTLLVYGTWDFLAPPGHGQALADAIAQSQLLLAPQETHFTVPFAWSVREALTNWCR